MMRPKSGIVVLMAILALLMIHTDALSRSTGKVTGRVTEAGSGEPLIGVNVTIAGTQQGAMTDTDGYYVILNIRPGTYEYGPHIWDFRHNWCRMSGFR
jgi:hypothetical protein